MDYTAKEIDRMSIDEIEYLAETLNSEEQNKWSCDGYSGKSYVEIIEDRCK